MKNLLFISLLLLLFSCEKEAETTSTTDAVSGAASSTLSQAKDPLFEQEKDEACDTEEDLEKKIEEAAKKPEAISLQGGDTGCDPNE
ncbi:MAG: hypothetical protein VXV96_11325 [Bdellovibrionota bacterium]|nr:hypothetical protein [Bdellovibrionota bacterium]